MSEKFMSFFKPFLFKWFSIFVRNAANFVHLLKDNILIRPFATVNLRHAWKYYDSIKLIIIKVKYTFYIIYPFIWIEWLPKIINNVDETDYIYVYIYRVIIKPQWGRKYNVMTCNSQILTPKYMKFKLDVYTCKVLSPYNNFLSHWG